MDLRSDQIGARLRELRGQGGEDRSMRWVAAKAGLSDKTIRDIEGGDTCPGATLCRGPQSSVPAAIVAPSSSASSRALLVTA